MSKEFQDGVDELLECSVCLEQFKEPKMLNCQHSFCFEPCLKNMVETTMIRRNSGRMREQKYIQCAICRKRSVVQDLNNFSDNLYLKKLLEIRKNRAHKTMAMNTFFRIKNESLGKYITAFDAPEEEGNYEYQTFSPKSCGQSWKEGAGLPNDHFTL